MSAASDAPAAALCSLSSQICLRYACHSNAPRLIAFKIETERRCQLLMLTPLPRPPRLLAAFSLLASLVPHKHVAMLVVALRIRD